MNEQGRPWAALFIPHGAWLAPGAVDQNDLDTATVRLVSQ